MNFFKWIVKQPVSALKFVSRHGRTKLGRITMSAIAVTVADRAGMPGAVEAIQQLPDMAQLVLNNPTMAAVGLVGMLLRDGSLKERFNH